jgi:hypothetical protein
VAFGIPVEIRNQFSVENRLRSVWSAELLRKQARWYFAFSTMTITRLSACRQSWRSNATFRDKYSFEIIAFLDKVVGRSSPNS